VQVLEPVLAQVLALVPELGQGPVLELALVRVPHRLPSVTPAGQQPCTNQIKSVIFGTLVILLSTTFYKLLIYQLLATLGSEAGHRPTPIFKSFTQ